MDPLPLHSPTDPDPEGGLGEANRLMRFLAAILLAAILALVGTATLMALAVP